VGEGIYTPGYGAYTPGYAQVPAPNYTVNQVPVAPVQSGAEAVRLTAEQLDQLTGPIALYPDPLLAQVLPAATFPDDIADAARYVAANPQPSEDAINAQSWDPSVKAIVHYPMVLRQMSDNMEWTQALGAAFVNQQQDVMASIQRLRAQAQVAGTLAPTPQQQVLADAGAIEILPANPQVIYVPAYDPGIAYARPSPLTFSPGFGVGLWLNNGCDWRRHCVTRGHDWSGHHRHDWGRGASAFQPWVRNPHRALPTMPWNWAQRAGAHGRASGNSHGWTRRAATPHVATPRVATPRVSPWTNRAPHAPRAVTPPVHRLTPPARVATPPHRPVTPQWRPQTPAVRPVAPVRPAAPAHVGPSPAMRAAAAQRAVQAQAAARAVQARAAAARAVQARGAAVRPSAPVAAPRANPYQQHGHRR
jgi:hypothetical protein